MRCKVCKGAFIPTYFLQKDCGSTECKQNLKRLKVKDKTTKPKKSIKTISDKRKAQNKDYGKIRLQFLSDHFLCERCQKPADEIHHKAGRNGERLNNVSDFMSVCRSCHKYIHDNPVESRKKGWLK